MTDNAPQWSTTWDRSKLFTYTNLSPNPINFVAPNVVGSADIDVDDSSVFQSVFGFGGTLSRTQTHYSACALH